MRRSPLYNWSEVLNYGGFHFRQVLKLTVEFRTLEGGRNLVASKFYAGSNLSGFILLQSLITTSPSPDLSLNWTNIKARGEFLHSRDRNVRSRCKLKQIQRSSQLDSLRWNLPGPVGRRCLIMMIRFGNILLCAGRKNFPFCRGGKTCPLPVLTWRRFPL